MSTTVKRPAMQPGQLILPAFGQIEHERILAIDDLFAIVSDKFPISPGHSLIIARRPMALFQALTEQEKARLLVWIDWAQQHLSSVLKPVPDGFNLGLNDGPAAGQTIAQLHFHVIPRYTGDVPDPRGGIRHIIPSKANYWCTAASNSSQLFTKHESPHSLKRPRVWTGNDESGRHHHGRIPLASEPLDLVLHWKAAASASPRLVGYFRFNIKGLLEAGYVRLDGPKAVRLRFVHTEKDNISIQVNQNSPRLLIAC